MKFTQLRENVFDEIQLNAGVLLKTFDPTTPTLSRANIIGATTGGVSFNDAPSFTDYGEDIDNCPKNTMELKRIDSREVTLSGTFVTVNKEMVASLAAAADVSGDKITPRDDLLVSDFTDLWWVGDYSSKNGNTKGGFVAVKMSNVLNTGGFQIQTSDKAKGNFAFEYTAHYSFEDPTKVPYEVYVHTGEDED